VLPNPVRMCTTEAEHRCHSQCEEYIAWRKEYDELKEKRTTGTPEGYRFVLDTPEILEGRSLICY
jgi:hypothetical protein